MSFLRSVGSRARAWRVKRSSILGSENRPQLLLSRVVYRSRNWSGSSMKLKEGLTISSKLPVSRPSANQDAVSRGRCSASMPILRHFLEIHGWGLRERRRGAAGRRRDTFEEQDKFSAVVCYRRSAGLYALDDPEELLAEDPGVGGDRGDEPLKLQVDAVAVLLREGWNGDGRGTAARGGGAVGGAFSAGRGARHPSTQIRQSHRVRR